MNNFNNFVKNHFLKVVYILVIVVLTFLFYFFKLNKFFTYENVVNVRDFILSFSFLGPLLIFALYIIFNLLCMPTLFWTFISGYLYGFTYGYVIAWIGMTIGLISSFIAARYIFRDDFIKKFGNNSIVQQIQYWSNKYHLWTVLFFRIFFIFPYNLQNIAYGLTDIKIWRYIIGSFLGIIPTTLLYTWLGHTIALNKLGIQDLGNIMTVIAIFITFFGIVFFTGLIVKRKLQFKSINNK